MASKAKSPEKIRERLAYLEGRQIIQRVKSDRLLKIIAKNDAEINELRQQLDKESIG